MRKLCPVWIRSLSGIVVVALTCVCSGTSEVSRSRYFLQSSVDALYAYRCIYGTFPSGSNAEIVGELKKKRLFAELAPHHFDEKGQILDHRGKPIVFFSSADDMMIVATIDSQTGLMDESILVPVCPMQKRKDPEKQAAEPGATDNPGNAQ